jgi:hypothetical protein
MLLKEMIAARGKRYEAVLKKGGHDSLHITFFDDSIAAKILLFRLGRDCAAALLQIARKPNTIGRTTFVRVT